MRITVLHQASGKDLGTGDDRVLRSESELPYSPSAARLNHRAASCRSGGTVCNSTASRFIQSLLESPFFSSIPRLNWGRCHVKVRKADDRLRR